MNNIIWLLAIVGLAGCTSGAPPEAHALPGGSNAYRQTMVMPLAPTDVAAKVSTATIGVPEREFMTVVCEISKTEGMKQLPAMISEGGAVKFDSGLIVRAQSKPEPGYSVAIRAANGLAGFVCAQDIELIDQPLP